MGNRFKEERSNLENKPVFEAMIYFEEFWFEQRDAFRNALKTALYVQEYNKKIGNSEAEKEKKLLEIDFSKYKNKDNQGKLPYQIMMLGGDDLLLITVPEIAIPLVNNFGKALDELSKNTKEKLSVAAGIAFVKSSFPFSQAHELAESLLSSAKVKSRDWNGQETTYRNTLDWHVHFPTGTEDIDEIRKQNYMLQYKSKNESNKEAKEILKTEILTQRPCTMKDAMKVWDNSKKLFDSINDKEDGNYDNSSGRNKYKGLRTLLKTGQKNVELFGKILDIGEHYLKYDNLPEISGKIPKLNTTFDVIELMDFHKREDERGTE